MRIFDVNCIFMDNCLNKYTLRKILFIKIKGLYYVTSKITVFAKYIKLL